MPMNQVIQEKRKELGLTQEQVAAYLGVSTPAVSKWETGASCPDLALLAPLARLLKTDLNTLMCFREGQTPREVNKLCAELDRLAGENRIGDAFAMAEEELRKFPNYEPLRMALTMVLDSGLRRSQLTDTEKVPFEQKLDLWYDRLAASSNDNLRHNVNFNRLMSLIQAGKYTKAQQLLDAMPENTEFRRDLPDKLLIQVSIHMKQGEYARAEKQLQEALHTALHRVNMLLYKLSEVEQDLGNRKAAKAAAERSCQIQELFDVRKFGVHAQALRLTVEEQDQEECIVLLRKMLNGLHTVGSQEVRKMLTGRECQQDDVTLREHERKTTLKALEEDPKCDFLRDREDFRELVEGFRKEIVE